MQKFSVVLLITILVLGAFVTLGMANNKEPVDYVNPFIGTDATSLPAPWGAYGGTYPGAVVPSGMIQLTPETREAGEPRGYYYKDKRIRYFSFVDHKSGYPSGSSGDIHMMPITEEIVEAEKDYSSSFSHGKETASPGYYMVTLQDYNIKTEFTTTERAGLCRFIFPKTNNSNILIFDFFIEFSKPFESYGAFKDGIFVHYNTSENEVILAKIGVSTVSINGARKNLEAEIPDWDFDRVQTEAKESWNRELKKIEVEGGTEDQKVIFYTALYHSLLLPYIDTDVSGEYRGRDGKVHMAEDYIHYCGFSPWDTFRSEHPLLTLLFPGKERDIIRSLIDVYEQTGWLPTGPMTGNHAIPIIVDSYLKGITDFNIEEAYQAMRKSLIGPPFGREDIASFLKFGYVPAEKNRSVTKTLEYAYNDWVLAHFAEIRNQEEDYSRLIKRAHYYRNIFKSSERFMVARNKDGSWAIGGYAEGNKWTYSCFVLHDVQGLINLMGGRKAFTEKLERCFEEGHYNHDNEPPLHYAYLFDYAGMPWKTQKYVRKVMAKSYTTEPGGLPGNDDLGALSSWYVFSAMGFYPVCPGRPSYEIGSPIFRKVTIHLSNGKDFVIEAHNVSGENKYIQSATLNSKSLNRPWIAHSEIVNGGTLTFQMGPQPNKEWGSAPEVAPPSMTEGTPKFEYSTLELASTEVNANEPLTMYLTVKNIGNAVGTTELKLYVDGEFVKSKWVLVEPGESKKVGITTILYELGDHEITIGSLEPKTVKVKAASLF